MTLPALQASCEIFAANRARGRIGLAVAAAGGATARTRVAEEGSLRVRFPGPRAQALTAVIVNTGGGIAGGDRFAFDLAVGPGAHLAATTAAAEKVYGSLGPEATLSVSLAVGPHGSLAWLPQETILFDRARLRRSLDVELAPDARLVLAEALVFGRTAMGEVVRQASLLDRWRVRRGGRLCFADTVRLDGDVDGRLREGAVAAGGAAIATVLIVPDEEAKIAAVRAVAANAHGEIGISAWNGLALARLVAPDGMSLRRDLTAVLAALAVPLPRSWLN